MPLRFVRRSSLFVTLLALLAATALVPLAISSWINVRKSREEMQDQQKKYLTRSAVALAEKMLVFEQNYSAQIRKIADAMRLAAGTSAGEVDPFEYLGNSGIVEEYHKQDPNYLVIRAINTAGRGGYIEPESLDATVRARLDGLVQEAIAGKLPADVAWTELIRVEGINELAMVAVLPVSNSVGEVFGVIEVLVSLREVVAAFGVEKPKGLIAYMVDKKGQVVIHGDPAVMLRRPSLSEIDLVVEFVNQKEPGRVTKSYESTASGTGSAERVVGSLAPVQAKSPTFGVVVEMTEKLAYAGIDQSVTRAVQTVIVTLVFAFGVALLFARQIARPIRELADKSRNIAAGHYGQTVEVRSSNEIGQLAETFNEMSEKLEVQMRGLERAARENHELFISSIRALAAAIDAKDPYTRGHSERVCRYSIIIARHLDLPPEEIRDIRVSALLHDVGKIGIDDRILRKPAALTDEEFEVMKQHPEKGAAIMESIPQLARVIPGMKYHHEKWEGGGYPDGLRGEDIPMQARIVAVADTFDAMTTTRPYQKAMELSYVISKIKSFAQTRFDPKVVDALVRAWQKGDIGLDESPRNVA